MKTPTPEEQGIPGIDTQTELSSETGAPYNRENFNRIGVTRTWDDYANVLSWGKGQCLAALDDGCDLSVPQWQGKKVVASYNAIDDNDDPTPVPPGYHGTTVAYPSSLNHKGILGVAYNNTVAHVRCASIVHLPDYESDTIAKGLQWVIDHHDMYSITTVNLSVLDNIPHQVPVATEIDAPLRALRELNIWVSAPCGNNNHTTGVSWPACQDNCFAIGAVRSDDGHAYLDRFANTDILVAAAATSSSNAYAAACSMILREAIECTSYDWKKDGPTLPDAMMRIFTETGRSVSDDATGLNFKELNLLHAVNHVYA
jgi:hypothetical protein